VPTTTLFTTCIVYGRLSADNEILALKAAGAHIIHVVWPALLLGLATSAVTMICFFDLIPPPAGCSAREPWATWRNCCIPSWPMTVHQQSRIQLEIHVKNIQGRKLQDVIFKRRAADGRFDVFAVAKEAELRVELAHNQILVEMRQCQVLQGENVGYVESRNWPVEIPTDFKWHSGQESADGHDVE